MVRTYSDNKYIYSVDMMFAYVYYHKKNISKIKVMDLIYQLNYECWGIPEKGINYSPMTVIKNPGKYPKEHMRIENAKLSFPIMMSYDGNIVDGMHRLSKAYLGHKKNIKSYIFDKNIMKKFIIGRKGDYENIDKLETYDYIKLYVDRFT